jgi:hypothetical protein
MSDEVQQKGYRIPTYVRGPIAPLSEQQKATVTLPPLADGQSQWTVEHGPVPEPALRAFTWNDARKVAAFVRDGLLMIVKGLERTFDLGKK